MFGKPRDGDDSDLLDSSAIDGFFGDEAAAANALEVHELAHRVEQVEAQISSQFTSLATYAQISQEQIELARSEAKAATERSEQRLTSLVDANAPTGSPSSRARPLPARRPTSPLASMHSSTPSPRSARASTSACCVRRHSRTRSPRCSNVSPRPSRTACRRANRSNPWRRSSRSPRPARSASLPVAPATDRQAVTPLSGPIADLSLNA